MDLTEILKNATDKEFVVRGLDDFSQYELDEFWDKKKSFRQGQTDNVPILVLGLSTKDACNYTCIFCYGPEFRGKKGGTPLTLDEQKRLIDEGTEMGARTVIYCCNGEPTIDEHLVEMVSHTHKNGLISVVVTNGFVIGNDEQAQRFHGMNAREFAHFLGESDSSLLTHIESLNPDLYEKITNVAGSYDIVMQAIANIQEAGFTKTLQN